MTRMSLGTHPHLLGFDRLERLVENTTRNEGGYPPYDIERTAENAFRITLAVAGFGKGDLDVTIEDRQLVIRGRQEAETDGQREFLYQGIAARQFQRTFLLADGVEVTNARMADGLLHVDLERAEKTPAVTSIEISKG